MHALHRSCYVTTINTPVRELWVRVHTYLFFYQLFRRQQLLWHRRRTILLSAQNQLERMDTTTTQTHTYPEAHRHQRVCRLFLISAVIMSQRVQLTALNNFVRLSCLFVNERLSRLWEATKCYLMLRTQSAQNLPWLCVVPGTARMMNTKKQGVRGTSEEGKNRLFWGLQGVERASPQNLQNLNFSHTRNSKVCVVQHFPELESERACQLLWSSIIPLFPAFSSIFSPMSWIFKSQEITVSWRQWFCLLIFQTHLL